MTGVWRVRGRDLPLDRTLILGILNVTPDSFSDGGDHLEVEAAVAHGLAMVSAGADVVDIGGESTRPGAESVSAEHELERVLPVVEGLVAANVTVSVDTSKAAVAASVLAAGGHVINDVTALGDPGMAQVVADAQAGLVLMHMQGEPRTMQTDPQYDDVVGEVRQALDAAAQSAIEAGVAQSSIVIDPGLGFGKTLEHNLQLLAATDVLAASGYPVMIGASRKSFLGTLLDEPNPVQRDLGTAAVTAFTIARGARLARVHNVSQIERVRRVADAIVSSEQRA